MNEAIGYKALIEKYKLDTTPHYRYSYISNQGKGQIRTDGFEETHFYPKSYALKDPNNLFQQLEFAIKYDGINLEILNMLFSQIDSNIVTEYVLQQPKSKYSRIIWFLYEYLTEKKLNISDSKKLKYILLLDPNKYFTLSGTKSHRHAVINNLIGNKYFCPIVRYTDKLALFLNKKMEVKAKEIATKYNPQLISRASNYLYAKETISSFEIEREKPSRARIARFVEVLKRAPSIELITKEKLIEIQNIIVDPRFADNDYRKSQNYVGETVNPYYQKIHYISPKPEDVYSLMRGLLETLEENIKSVELHPVIIAAVIAFGFVFIHPFEDGNGRIHRFLIHYILSKNDFTPLGIIFPVSAVMLQKMNEYDKILESFSKKIMDRIKEFNLTEDGILTVAQPTKNYYQFIDYTHFAEYLFECIDETLHNHFENEIKFLIHYDKTKTEIQSVVDLPDNLIDLFIRFVMQNNGEMSSRKKLKYFDKLEDNEIKELEEIVRNNML